MRASKRRALIHAELDSIKSDINDLYWTFTRCARGKPPVVVRPDLYARRRALLAELAAMRR